MGAHAKLSASGSKRWLGCAGSIALSERLPDHMWPPSGQAAMLGTCAHALGERCLHEKLETSRGYKGQVIWLDEEEDAHFAEAPKDIKTKSELVAHCGIEGAVKFMARVDDTMIEGVDLYLTTVWRDLAEMSPQTEMFIERRFSLEWLRPGMFGTSDCSLYEFLGLLRIIDYKNGYLAVEVADNSQEKYYALGLAHDVDWLFSEIELVIVQPNAAHGDGSVRRWRCTKEELLAFRDELAHGADVVEEARAALADILDNDAAHGEEPAAMREWEGTYLDPGPGGKHCDFCPIEATGCPALMNAVNQVARMDFADDPHDLEVPPDLADGRAMARIAQILEWAPRIDSFIRSTKALGQRLREEGHDVPRHKLVRGRATRRWVVGESAMVKALVEHAGLAADDLYDDPKLLSPAKAEKLGKKVKEIINKGIMDGDTVVLAPLCEKGQGKLTLVHESDNRPEAIVDPGSDFDDMPDEED